VTDKEAENSLKYADFTTAIQYMWNVKQSGTSDNMGNWHYLKITGKMHEKHNWKARYRKQPYWAPRT
jgi:hypothetical protein